MGKKLLDGRKFTITTSENIGIVPVPKIVATFETGSAVMERPVSVDVAASSETSISRIQASIAEAKTHESPLSGRKMLADMEFLMNEVLGRAGDLEYSRKRADEADAEVERLKAKSNDQAAELQGRKDQVVELQAGLAKLKNGGPNDGTTSNAVQLGAARARIKHLEKELAQRGPPPEAGPWDWLLVDMAGNYRSGDECWSSGWEHGERVTEARAREFAKEHQGGLGCLAISMADAKQRDRDDRWLILSTVGDKTVWWRVLGKGVTSEQRRAHCYKWLEAKRSVGLTEHSGRTHVIHISDVAP